MSGLSLAIVCGCLIGLGMTLVLAYVLPGQPNLKQAFDRLDPKRERDLVVTDPGSVGLQQRVGIWAQRRAPAELLARVPRQELRLLDRPVHQFFGEKVLLGLVGLLFPPLFTMLAGVLGIHLPFMIPVAGSLVLAGVLFMLPDASVRNEAIRARRDFTRALASYVDLVALERASGTGTTQAMEAAANVGDSWVFVRISEVLGRARWSGQAPWDGLKDLSEQIGIPDLADLAEIMRISREEGASVTTQLRARSASIRSALLNEDLSKANAAGEQMSVPVSALALIFLALIATPAILRIAFGG